MRGCLDCPFPDCIHDEEDVGEFWLKDRRYAIIAEFRRATNMSISELGSLFNVSKRTIYRALEAIKKQDAEIKNGDKNE